MHILMVLDQTYPPDQRVENEITSLIEAGFKVSLLSVGDDGRSEEEHWNSHTIYRCNIPIGIRNKFRGFVGRFNLYAPLLFRQIKKIHRKTPIHAIHTHDLYLAQVGVLAKRKWKIPFVLDLHENYVQALGEYAWSTRFPGNWVISLDRWKSLEQKWVQQADRIIVVIEEMKQRYLEMGISGLHLITTPNTPHLESFRSSPIDAQILSAYKSKKVALYSGGFDLHRGLFTAIEAMSFLKEKHPELLLVLVGDGRITPDLKAKVQELGLDNRIIFEGWQPSERIRSYVQRADIGLIPHLRSGQTDASIPHKLGYYMSEELPVISTNCTSLERMINEHHAGLIYPSGDASALAQHIELLLSNPSLAQTLAQNGKKAAETVFNWSATVQPLLSYYQSIR